MYNSGNEKKVDSKFEFQLPITKKSKHARNTGTSIPLYIKLRNISRNKHKFKFSKIS